MTVRRPKVERRLSYSPITTKTETLVKVVDPRTGRVVRTYCNNDENTSTLPWLHVKETVTYEIVTVKVGTPISLTPVASTSRNSVIHGNEPVRESATTYQSRYPDETYYWPAEMQMLSDQTSPAVEGAARQTIIGL